MGWVGERVRDARMLDAYLAVEDAASWSEWLAFDEAVPWAPREPGVYLLRDPASQVVVHVGMAGERAASGRPRGLRGRLATYRTGQDAVGGFVEAALDRALADPDWVARRLDDLRSHGPRRTRQWAAAAVAHAAPEVSWAVRPERADAKLLADQVELLLRPHGLWTR
ncbi:hypothetical protein [Nocardioides lijunqiniae]|uniref:hypothetical protein n=1 Tax=Nocardioides lijunqiniae TaxID=2760832 RepID=UPI001D0CCF56|nr:hypothetical protein [Nocardioides lijunqiniae]